jgi:hypothetical protein
MQMLIQKRTRMRPVQYQNMLRLVDLNLNEILVL